MSERKPIFLSVGYSNSHWCQVMEAESFSNPEIARRLNQNFIPLKVDREERPDLDRLYSKVQAWATGQESSPLHLFLSPHLKAFFAGAYFPPEARYGLPPFAELLDKMAELWNQGDPRLESQAAEAMQLLAQDALSWAQPRMETEDGLKLCEKNLLSLQDKKGGGFGTAPKFFYFEALRFLLRLPEQRAWVEKSLKEMAKGAVFDLVSGGLHRFSEDGEWRRPHFEKRLVENAQFCLLLAESIRFQDSPVLRWILQRNLNWIESELKKPNGLYATALLSFGSSKDEEFYSWRKSDLPTQGPLSIDSLGGLLDLSQPENEFLIRLKAWPQTSSTLESVTELCEALHTQRSSEKQSPGASPLSVVSENAILIQAWIEASRVFSEVVWMERAKALGERLWSAAWQGGRLSHGVYSDLVLAEGFLEDAAQLGLAFVGLYQRTKEEKWRSRSEELARWILESFYDSERGFLWYAPKDQEDLLMNFQDVLDSHQPASSAVAFEFLSRSQELELRLNLEEPTQRLEKHLRALAEKQIGGFTRFSVVLADKTAESHSAC